MLIREHEKYRLDKLRAKIQSINSEVTHLYVVPSDSRYSPFNAPLLKIGHKYLQVGGLHRSECRFKTGEFAHVDDKGFLDYQYVLHASQEDYEKYKYILSEINSLSEAIGHRLPYLSIRKLKEILKITEQ